MSTTASPKSSLAKLGLYPKPKPFKVMVLGQAAVGKSDIRENVIGVKNLVECFTVTWNGGCGPEAVDVQRERFATGRGPQISQNTHTFYSHIQKLNLGWLLGPTELGDWALVVRFITRRFIGEYDPNLEKIYSFQTVIDNEMVYFEILDSAGAPHESEYANLESNIRWAEAFVLVYSVTDKCSFDECHRLKFLINYNKKRRRIASSMKQDNVLETPVVLVGNKVDLASDRMVSTEEGRRRGKEIGCVCFHEISVRESIDQVWGVFRDARRFWRVGSKGSRGRAPAEADVLPSALERPLARAASDTTPGASATLCRWAEMDEQDEANASRSGSTSSSERSSCAPAPAFRARASTDPRLPPRPARARHPPAAHGARAAPPPVRRLSVAMRGNNASTY